MRSGHEVVKEDEARRRSRRRRVELKAMHSAKNKRRLIYGRQKNVG